MAVIRLHSDLSIFLERACETSNIWFRCISYTLDSCGFEFKTADDRTRAIELLKEIIAEEIRIGIQLAENACTASASLL